MTFRSPHTLFVLGLGLTLPVATPLFAAPTAPLVAPSMAGWNYQFSDDDLEESWSYATRLEPQSGPFEARVAFHYTTPQKYLLLRVQNDGKATAFSFWSVEAGRVTRLGEPQVTLAGTRAGLLTIQRSSWRARALWNGRVVLNAYGNWQGGEIGAAAKGVKLSQARLQPTEPIVKQDDFMTLQGPQDTATPRDEVRLGIEPVDAKAATVVQPRQPSSEWRSISGSWKTSMMLDARVRFDSSLNPNPFVYRADSDKGSVAANQAISTIGKWFWNDYTVAVALKPVLKNPEAPLIAGVSAYGQSNGQALIGEVDFRSGRATLRQGNEVLAQSVSFNCAPNQWHRLFLDPGPGTIRLLVDGVERLRIASPNNPANWQSRAFAQGDAGLRAQATKGNFVDFDDVSIAPNDAISDDFSVAAVGRWESLSGEWQTIAAAPGKPGSHVTLKAGPALSVTGDLARSAGMAEANFARERAGRPSGIVFAVRDAKNYFVARQRSAALEIVEVAAGKARVLGQTPLGGVRGQAFGAHPMTVEWRDGFIVARCGFPNMASFTATATVNEIPAGRVGLWADGAPGAVATSFRVMGASPGFGEPPLPDRFQKDRLMKFWASNAAAWKSLTSVPELLNSVWSPGSTFKASNGQSNADWKLDKIWLHTGDFFSDAAVTVPIPDIPVGGRLALHLRENFDVNPVAASPLVTSRRALTRQAVRPAGITRRADPTAIPTTLSVQSDNVQGSVPGGARLEIERVADEWKFSLYEGAKLVKSFSAPRVPDDGKSEKARPLLRFVRRPLGGDQVALRIALDGKLLLSESAPASQAGTKILVRLKNITPVIELPTPSAKVPVGAFYFENAVADTTARLDYAFTGAPVDWLASRGRWEVAERWTCQPQFGFFRGDNAVDPTLWSRFATRGDWTMEAYLATPMDHTRGERSPQDLNVTVNGDGRELDSGYSFIFAPRGTGEHLVLRGGEVAQRTSNVMPNIFGGVHQDWFYIRIERRATPQGLRFRWSVNGKEIANYLDTKPLANALDKPGRFAFWTHNFGLSIARVRLWHNGLHTAPDTTSSPELLAATPKAPNSLDEWSPRRDGVLETSARFQKVSDGKGSALRVTNPQSGGDWTLFVSRKPFDAAQRPTLRFDYRVPNDVFVNLYAKIEGRWWEIAFTGDRARGVSANPDPPSNEGRLGKITNVGADNQWHTATFDLQKALKTLGLPMQVEALTFAAPERGYLRAGIGGNHQGATYWLRDFQAVVKGTPTAVAAAP